MSRLKRSAGLAAIAGRSSPASAAQLDSASRVCARPGRYLTAIRTGKHNRYDRVVFQFSGGVPAVTVERVATVYADPKGTPLWLAGKSRLHVVFRGASANCPQPAHRTWTGPAVLKPGYPELRMVRAAGDFEGYLSFGIGLAARSGYHVSSLTGPDRVVIDVRHPRP
jgi:hypothetical protein